MATLIRQFWFKPAVVIGLLVLGWWLLPGWLGVMPVYLWTDRLVFVLVAGGLLLAGYIRRTEHLRQPWLQIFRQRRAMVALVVLLAFIVTGLLDSVHYRKPLPVVAGQNEAQYSVEVLSLLDELLVTLREHEEKTYSAPFAIHLYARESVTLPDGRQARIYPRLKYGGAHLTDPAQRTQDILFTAGQGALPGLAIAVLVSLLIALSLARRQQRPLAAVGADILHGRTDIPWRAILVTVMLIASFIAMALVLSQKYHVFGTDKVGEDVLYLAIKSIRTGLVIGTLTTLVMLPFAIVLGIMAGYFLGWVDDVIQYLYTTLSSIPGVLLIAAAILSIQVYIANHPDLFETATDRADLRLLALCVILGITSWTSLCRLLRGETFKLREMDYIQAATAFGVGHFTILGRHILPNVMHIVLIMVVLDFSGLVLAEAVLSYVGVGVDPSTISWGNMINGARLELAREPVVWWSLAAAFVFMFTLVLAANLFADAVRDAFDPRIREQVV
jgi:peptide/nickel transport system permease protein